VSQQGDPSTMTAREVLARRPSAFVELQAVTSNVVYWRVVSWPSIQAWLTGRFTTLRAWLAFVVATNRAWAYVPDGTPLQFFSTATRGPAVPVEVGVLILNGVPIVELTNPWPGV